MEFFSKLKLNYMYMYLWKMHGYPQCSFWIPRAIVKFCFLRIVLNHAKKFNIPVLISAVDRKSEYHEMRRMYVQ